MNRRDFLRVSAGATAAMGLKAIWFEPNRVSVTDHVIGDASSGGVPLRLVQLSDLHLKKIGRHEEQIAQKVHELHPDVILHAGDAIDQPDHLDTLDTFLALLPSTRWSFAILGNWEHWARIDLLRLRAIYASHGVQLLVNEHVELAHEGARVVFCGVDDATGGAPDIERALGDAAPAANSILLAHSPIYRDHLPKIAGAWQPEYMLSGHTHGGQMKLLGWAPFRPPGSGRYIAGW